MLPRHHNLLQSCHLLLFNLLLQYLVETINLVDNLSLLDELHKISLQLVNTHMELLRYLMQGNDTISLYMLLKSFLSNIPEDRHILVLPKVWVKSQLVFDSFQVSLKFEIVAI